MTKKKLIIIIGITALVVGFLFMQMYSVDLLPASLKGDKNASENEAKGKALLKKAWVAHGVDSLLQHQTYQFTGVDDWKGMMGNMGKLWPQTRTRLNFKYAPNTFDAKVEFLDGETKGHIAGLQSWNYYEKPVGGKVNFEIEKNQKHTFGMAAFQYFTELVGRLSRAELIRYIGEKKFNGNQYDLVFATWNTLEGNDKNDQYILYINRENNMLEYATYTVRDNYLKMPGSSMFYGSINFTDFHNIDGFQVPFTQTVFLNEPQESNENYVHQLKLESFSFDGFELAELYPDPTIKLLGDAK